MPKGDVNIYKADTDDGYTPIANLLLEALAFANLSGVQKGICLFLFRRTYGWGVKEESITLNDFASATGSSPSYISRQLKQLINWNVIQRVHYEPGKTPIYSFNTRLSQWDKGCLNVQGLYKRIRQGLYKRSREGFTVCATLVQGQLPEGVREECPPKESIKESEINNNITPQTPLKADNVLTFSPKDKPPETVEEAIKFFPRYNELQEHVIKQYWDTIRFTRRNGKIAPNVVKTRMEYWERFPADIVIKALQTHISKHSTKRENYTDGIMRGLEDEQRINERSCSNGRASPHQQSGQKLITAGSSRGFRRLED